MRFVVIQVGARMHYAVPALLAQAGMLDRFYTDIHGEDWLVRGLFGWWPSRVQPKPVKRLVGRRLPSEIKDRVRSEPLRSLRRFVGGVSIEEVLRRRVLKEGFGGAEALYTLDNRDLPLVKRAKEEGLFVVYEQILNADVGRILYEERALFPAIEAGDSIEKIETDERWDREMWKAADLLLSPSEFVSEGMASMGAERGKLALVPYGVSEDWLEISPSPVAGRVLFVGTVGLRKGNHYLAKAQRELAKRNAAIEVRVAGPHSAGVPGHELFRGPHYLGQVPRSQVREEFRQADVFVMPTLSDSFAVVHLEAMACGVPVITTPHCGSVVRDGVDGFIVPIRDADALADRIELLVANRRLREEMSRNARARAQEFIWARYGERLMGAIQGYSIQGAETHHV